MDPDAANLELETIIATQRQRPLTDDEVARGAELLNDLNQWISNGGFPPKAWGIDA
ncbi:hypothetical protein SEA_NEDARYA_83 [Gordonia phage Nedarya]|nr:hypothetical protein SEA_NEDARYA_83 [Gordonia phage Nedarya]